MLILTVIFAFIAGDFIWHYLEKITFYTEDQELLPYLIVKSAFKTLIVFAVLMPNLSILFWGLGFTAVFALIFWMEYREHR